MNAQLNLNVCEVFLGADKVRNDLLERVLLFEKLLTQCFDLLVELRAFLFEILFFGGDHIFQQSIHGRREDTGTVQAGRDSLQMNASNVGRVILGHRAASRACLRLQQPLPGVEYDVGLSKGRNGMLT